MSANCRGADTELFYSVSGWPEAAKICHGCPIKLQCRQDHADDPYAFAGGMTPSQRSSWVTRNLEARVRAQAMPKGPRTPTSGPKAKVSAETILEVLRIWDGEMIGTKALADRVGLAKSTVQRILEGHDRRRTPEERREMAARAGASASNGEHNRMIVGKLLAENYTPKQISGMVGITLSHVYVIRRRIEKEAKI